MSEDNTIKPISLHPCMSEAQGLEWETWKAMASLITAAGIDFNDNKDVSKAIAAWGYRYLILAIEYAELNNLESCAPPLFYSALAEKRIRDEYLEA